MALCVGLHPHARLERYRLVRDSRSPPYSCALLTLIDAARPAGLLANVRVGPHTKISVTAAALKISLWTQLLKFLRSPTQEKLIVLQLSYVHLKVETSQAPEKEAASQPQKKPPTPSFLQTLDTSIAWNDVRHPMWATVRSWIPRLLFVCRCVHAIEVGAEDLCVDVVQKDPDTVTPVLGVQVYNPVIAFEHAKTINLTYWFIAL
ncbi:unnamed protein product [Phytophthora fragariaefolia]|uniref:Unnamed protein product n=1 Tax=Phytophthora fragariaefolia TaxID=1490495 RepID=A0A9W6TUX0_9STRA|nr:unnamed protein product [Phytophthora fragariaefolia]